eukprot:616271-Prymnesium_polylepis.1
MRPTVLERSLAPPVGRSAASVRRRDELALMGHNPGPQVHRSAKRQPPGSPRKKKMHPPRLTWPLAAVHGPKKGVFRQVGGASEG